MNYKNGSVIGVNNIPTVSDASGVWDLDAVQQSREDAIWPVFLIKQLLDSSNLSSTSDGAWITKTYAFTSSHVISGTTGRFVVHHYGTTSFRSDVQYDDIIIPASGGNEVLNFEAGNESCETTRSNVGSSITGYVGATFYTLLDGGSSVRWNRDSGGTGSSGTGNTTDGSGSSTGYYVYTETSGSHPMSMLFRTAEYTLAASGTFQWREGYWGSNLAASTRDVYWIVS